MQVEKYELTYGKLYPENLKEYHKTKLYHRVGQEQGRKAGMAVMNLSKTHSKCFKVWTGNQDCEPVTWRECNLVPRTQSFFVPRVSRDEMATLAI